MSLHGNLTVVGDPNQSIYRHALHVTRALMFNSWRNAEANIFDQIQADYPTAVTVQLRQSYRSTTSILRASSAVLQDEVWREWY